MTMNLTETADKRTVNDSPLSHPILPGTPVKVEGRLDRYVVAQHEVGNLWVLWSASGPILADREDITPLSAEADPSALRGIAMLWLFRVGQTLGASEMLRLATVQIGCPGAWLVKSKHLINDRNDCEEQDKEHACFCCTGMGQHGGNGYHFGGIQRHSENVAVGRPSRAFSEAHGGDALGCLQYPKGAVQSRVDARFHGQHWTPKAAPKGGCSLPGKPTQ
jgi:hypothetical protein